MAKKENKSREDRIVMEIVVDAYGSDERAIGWYYSLEGKLRFPFIARCAVKRAISPLKVGERVAVVGMPPESECQQEMFVTIRRDDEELAVPLAQLKVAQNVDPDTREIVEDWLYWVEQGYEF